MAEWSHRCFDQHIFHAFIKSIGIYPLGSLVRLASDRLWVVIEQTDRSLLTPVLRAFFYQNKLPNYPGDTGLIETALQGQDASRMKIPKNGTSTIRELWSGLAARTQLGWIQDKNRTSIGK